MTPRHRHAPGSALGQPSSCAPAPVPQQHPSELRDSKTFVFIDAAAEDADEHRDQWGAPRGTQPCAAGGTWVPQQPSPLRLRYPQDDYLSLPAQPPGPSRFGQALATTTRAPVLSSIKVLCDGRGVLCNGRGRTPLSTPPSTAPSPALFLTSTMKPVPSWEQPWSWRCPPDQAVPPLCHPGPPAPAAACVWPVPSGTSSPPAAPASQGTLALNWLTPCTQRDLASSVAAWASSQPTGCRGCSRRAGLSQAALAASQPQEQGWGHYAPQSPCSWAQGGDTGDTVPLLSVFVSSRGF